MYCYVFLICILHQFLSCQPEPRIIDGQRANIRDFPYYVAIDNCGATILSNRWLLTAAHCVDNPLVIGRRMIYAGSERKGISKGHRYDEIKIHPDYIPFRQGYIAYDLALLKLHTPLNFSDTIKPVRLPIAGTISRNPAHVFVGRGLDETGKPSKSLMKIRVNRLKPAECSKLFGTRSNELPHLMDNSLICTRRADRGPGVCMGDSGGPLVQNGIVMGVASFLPIRSRDCTRTNIAFYTNVPTFVPWIKSITGLK